MDNQESLICDYGQDPINKNPECATMQISIVPQDEFLILKLEVNFGEVTKIFAQGLCYVRYGLSRSELDVSLENGTLPLKYRWPIHRMEEFIPVERNVASTTGSCNTTSKSKTSFLGFKGATASGQIDENIATSDKENRVKQIENVFSFKQVMISTQGATNNPKWIFKTIDEEPILSRSLIDQIIGKICITGSPCKISAKLISNRDDITITFTSDLMPDISANKKSILKIITRKAIMTSMTPYISMHVLNYG